MRRVNASGKKCVSPTLCGETTCRLRTPRIGRSRLNDSVAGDRYSSRAGAEKSGIQLSALSMVTSVEIKNFRGFKEFVVNDLAPINVIVGDNASGKTAFLETIYLAVSGNAQQPFILKQWRGQDIRFQGGSVDSAAEAIYADLFHDSKSDEPITIKLTGRGFENRQLTIFRSSGVIVPTKEFGNRHERRAAKKNKSISFQAPIPSQTSTIPIVLTWSDERGNAHTVRASLKPSGLEFEGTNERLPYCFLFASLTAVSEKEAAGHFSALKKNRSIDKFRRIFLSVFDQIVDIDLGDVGGNSVLLADVPWAKELLPLPLLSGGTNRATAILLSITHRQNGLVMVDEIENGIFHARQHNFSRALLELARAYETQLILTTHSEEWIERFIEAADEQVEDIAFWRLERKDNRPVMRKFSLPEFRSGMAAGEMR
jgi:AAA ATPase domain/AAA domain, putative AbiEii toxin, Type IV TA system